MGHEDTAPGGVGDLLLRFVNTRPILHPDDELASAQAADRWFTDAGLLQPGDLVSEADASAARELRTALVTLLKSHVDSADAEELELAERTLDRAATAHPLAPRITTRGAAFVPIQPGVAGALAAILAEVATIALDERAWARFKACKNPTCHRGFHDNSRPASAKYCMHSCSSQASMRALRERRKNL